MTCPNCKNTDVMYVPETETHWCGGCDHEWSTTCGGN